MTATPHAPADVRDMGIIHSALRRDLERTRIVLGGAEPISDERLTSLVWTLPRRSRRSGLTCSRTCAARKSR